MSQLRIDIFSHHFVVTGFSFAEHIAIKLYLSQLIHVETHRTPQGELVSKLTKVFAASNSDRTEYRLHIHSLKSFVSHLTSSGISASSYTTTEYPTIESVDVEIPMNPKFVPRKEDQEPIINYFVNSPHKVLLAELQTGKGKTFSALTAASRIGKRFAIVLRAQYIENWMVALIGKKNVTELSSDDIIIVQGSAFLKELIHRALIGELTEKTIIIGNRTLANFISKYEDEGCQIESYGCNPVDLWSILGVGVLIKDETHLDFHFNFKLDCYTHVERTISLSATFRSTDPFIKRMQALQFPLYQRAPEVPYHRYVNVVAVRYHVPDEKLYPHTIRGRTDYNHNRFENSILSRAKGLKEYKQLVMSIVTEDYLKVKSDGEKMLIIFSSVEMCQVMADMLNLADTGLAISKYTAGDSFDVAINSDIIVTTIISGSTAIDIPNLKVELMTCNIGSENTNLQALGRLRELASGETPTFLYLFTDDLRSPSRYHHDKLELFRPRVLSIKTVDSRISLR